MVVRLGQGGTPPPAIRVGQRYRILQGQALHLHYIANDNPTVRAWARVVYDNGEPGLLFIADEAVSSEVAALELTPSDIARMDGWVTDALVEVPLDADVKRGQIYCKLTLEPFGPVLCSDYVFSRFGQVALGTYIQAGPGGGGGNLELVTVKAEAVPAITTYTLAASNTIRNIHGFTWYYLSSADAASRTLNVVLRNPSGVQPTGMPAIDTWAAATLTLTISQAGGSWAHDKRSGTNDNGTIAIQNVTTAPTPFPLLVEAGYLGTLVFTPGSFHANDLDTIHLLQEEWVVLY